MAFCSGSTAEMSCSARRRFASRACRARSAARSAGSDDRRRAGHHAGEKIEQPFAVLLRQGMRLGIARKSLHRRQAGSGPRRGASSRRVPSRRARNRGSSSPARSRNASNSAPPGGRRPSAGCPRRPASLPLRRVSRRERESNNPKSGRPAPVSASSAVAWTAGSSPLPTALRRFSSAGTVGEFRACRAPSNGFREGGEDRFPGRAWDIPGGAGRRRQQRRTRARGTLTPDSTPSRTLMPYPGRHSPGPFLRLEIRPPHPL